MKRITFFLAISFAVIACSSYDAVTVIEDAETYTMDNGIVAARVSKVTGDLVSFRYKGEEMFATALASDKPIEPLSEDNPGNPNWKTPTISGKAHGYWSHDAMGVRGSEPAIPSVSINPSKNGGRIAEVSVKAISKGRRLGTGPGTDPASGNLAVDIDIRYTLERGASGVYTYCIFNHPADYPLGQFGEARYCAKLAPEFDWMSVDKDVDFYYPTTHNAGDKYVYTAVQSENPAFGWSSTTKNVGLFFINPSMEYMSGGPTKVEFMGHRNTSREAEGCVLNYWRSSHYGGASASIAEGEEWNKIIGPFLIYANAGEGHDAIYADAKARAVKEQQKWPYKWMSDPNYSKAKDRCSVSGRFAVNDSLFYGTFANLYVGLAHSEYVEPGTENHGQRMIGWQRDAKHYQFWTVGNEDGSFLIDKVIPGEYCLYAFTDGILGEYVKADVKLEKGEKLNLGTLEWIPVRKGEQIWEIGIPNRNGSEFYGADQRRDPELPIKYAVYFPEDITYTVGSSDFAKDWFFIQVPHNTDPDVKPLPFFGIRANGNATPYTVKFNMDESVSGLATVRMALCGVSSTHLTVVVNGNDLGPWKLLQTGDNVIVRHGSHGIWHEEEFSFDAGLLQKGENSISLILPAGELNSGIVYDYLRLEIS